MSSYFKRCCTCYKDEFSVLDYHYIDESLLRKNAKTIDESLRLILLKTVRLFCAMLHIKMLLVDKSLQQL